MRHLIGGDSDGKEPEMHKNQVQSLSQKDSLEKGMEAHSSILAWSIPWTGKTFWATVHGVTKSWT